MRGVQALCDPHWWDVKHQGCPVSSETLQFSHIANPFCDWSILFLLADDVPFACSIRQVTGEAAMINYVGSSMSVNRSSWFGPRYAAISDTSESLSVGP